MLCFWLTSHWLLLQHIALLHRKPVCWHCVTSKASQLPHLPASTAPLFITQLCLNMYAELKDSEHDLCLTEDMFVDSISCQDTGEWNCWEQRCRLRCYWTQPAVATHHRNGLPGELSDSANSLTNCCSPSATSCTPALKLSNKAAVWLTASCLEVANAVASVHVFCRNGRQLRASNPAQLAKLLMQCL